MGELEQGGGSATWLSTKLALLLLLLGLLRG